MHFTNETRLEDLPPQLKGPFERWKRINSKTFEERFWDKVDRRGTDDCWLYLRHTNGNGYGSLRLAAPSRKSWLAHRIAWVLSRGHIPDGMFVCHKCDVKLCCNPAHLFLGTPKDNMQDMIKKGRRVKVFGRLPPTTVLSEAQVLEIRRRYHPDKTTYPLLAKEFGVSRSSIGKIVTKMTWKNVTHGTLK